MPKRPPAPGATTARRDLQRLILRRQARTIAAARKALRSAPSRDGYAHDVALMPLALSALQEVLATLLNLSPAELEQIRDIAARIVEAGIRSAAKRSSALSEDPRTWGADEARMIAQAVESQAKTVLKSYLDAGAWFAEDLQQKLAEAQALGTPITDVSKMLRQRYGVAETYADRTALQVTRAGVEQAANERMAAAGVEYFTWRAVDRFARPLHRALNGQKFPVGVGAPGEGLPGEPWGCRCFAEPVIPDSLTQNQQQLPGQAFQETVKKNDPSGLPLLPEVTPSSMVGQADLSTLLSEMVSLQRLSPE